MLPGKTCCLCHAMVRVIILPGVVYYDLPPLVRSSLLARISGKWDIDEGMWFVKQVIGEIKTESVL